ncbi:MAG: Ig-like domain repeat protein, partial [Myxococcales bacterium]|nr:Ig-like domain repeat protein [Myxococcales bacterium]
SHTVSVRHVDDMDNVSEAATTSAWTVDATAPSAPGSFTGVPSSPTNSTTATIGFTLGEADGTVECRLDAGSWGECSSVSGTTGSHSVSGLADGSHSVSVRQTDALGNVSAVGTSSSWTVDRTPPVAPSVSRVSPSAHLSNETTASIAYSGEAGVSFSCSLDGGAWTACSASPVSLSSVADGLHTFSVKAVDDAGNESQEASVSWDVDTVPHAEPVVDLSSPESSPSNSTSATVAWEGVPGATYLCSLDGASYEVCPNSPALLTDLGEGSHTFRVKARDAVGNLSDAGSVTWVVDVTAPAAPVVSLDSPSTSPSRSTSAAISYSGEAGATFTCSLDGGAWRPCEASPENLDGLADGSHTLRVRATDAAGNISDVSSVTWVVDSVAPAAPVLSGAPSGSTSTTSAWISFTGESGASFECAVDGGAYAACVSPQGLLSLSVGAHVFSVRALDSAGNVGQAATVSWTVVAAPSSVTIPTVLTPPAGTKTVYRKGDRWAIKVGALFSTNGDTRNAAKLQTLQVAVDSKGRPVGAKPSDSASAPKRATYANGILAFSNAVAGELLRQSFAQPVWVRASNKAGKWTGWVKLTP